MSPVEETDNICPFCGKEVTGPVEAHHLLPGTILNKKFYIGRALGEGGFGITYIGRDINLDMKVAIKEYYPNGYVNRSNTISPKVNDSVTEGRREFLKKAARDFCVRRGFLQNLRENRVLCMYVISLKKIIRHISSWSIWKVRI